MNVALLSATSVISEANLSAGYLSEEFWLPILGYLIYTLLHPEKF